jgi:hypothetical protein
MFIVPFSRHFLLWQETPVWAYSFEVMEKIEKEFARPSFQMSLDLAKATCLGAKNCYELIFHIQEQVAM